MARHIHALLIGIVLLSSCKTAIREPDPAFDAYIESYTGGTISRQSPIRIRLNAETGLLYEEGAPISEKLFSFVPRIPGQAFWADPRTIEFRPEKELDPGRLYKGSFRLARVTEVPAGMEDFEFQFTVISPSFELEDRGLWIEPGSSPEYFSLKGTVATADTEAPSEVEKILSVEYGGDAPRIRWQHDVDSRSYHFSIDSIRRGEKEGQLLLKWYGKPIRAEQKGEKKISVPARGEFRLMGVHAMQDPEHYILLQFSQPLSPGQALEGLVGVGGLSSLRFDIEGSQLKVYAPDPLEGEYALQVHEGIQSSNGQRLGREFKGRVYFENRMPAVSMLGRGNILPQTGKLVLPFEAVNLTAVDVSVIRIYERNIPQFLQQNELGGNYELRRVARPVAQKTIRLDSDQSLDLTKKQRFSLDLDELIRTEPGAIYHVTIGFRKAYSLYACAGESDTRGQDGPSYLAGIDEDDLFWSRYDQYYPYGFNWKERNNPCHDSYYNKERWASRNLIASNLGLIAKRDGDNSLLVAVTDLLSAAPLRGVELELLDYQQQVLQQGRSDGEGLARFRPERKPFLLVAKQGAQRAYLKLDDGNSLPLSRFDVGGEQIQHGLKGFIYGERGVWRPGDTLFLSFVLEDKSRSLPPGHPLSLEVFTPQGQLYHRSVKALSEIAFHVFPVATTPDAPTGNWTARVKVGGAEFSKRLKIETIMPNRLKIDLDFGGQRELRRGEEHQGRLSARWLFGGTARNLKARVDLSLVPSPTRLGSFEAYSFDDPAASFVPELTTVFDGKLDGEGRAGFKPPLSAGSAAPGMLEARFQVRVFEPGGNFSIDQFTLPYHAYRSYAGIRLPEGQGERDMLLTGEDHRIDLVNVDARGELLKGLRKVKVELYKVRWRWWWDEHGDEFSNFTNDSYKQLLKEEIVDLKDGRGQWTLRVDYPEWGRYLLRVHDLESGHVSGKALYIDWPGWYERLREEYPAEAAMLSFASDKEKYQVGEEVVLTIPSSEGGRCLISIESGSKVLESHWVETGKGQTLFKFAARPEMAPNVYVNVTMLQPHSQSRNDLPVRMYGVVPVLVEAPETVLKPEIRMPASIQPEEKVSLEVSEASGRPMTYTLAVVDEGLLDLTRFRTPDPHAAFYAREALGVKTWDLYDAVIGAWGSGLERILSIGGDDELDRGAGAARANRFKPIVKFMGPFQLDKGASQRHTLRLDPYIGSVRVMVVAGHQGAYGKAEKAVAVKKPLMLLATLPRVLAPGEKLRMPVTVFSTEGGAREVSLSFESNQLIRPSGAGNRKLHFDGPGEQLAYFDLEVGEGTGIARVRLQARSGNQQAGYELELDVRNPNPVLTQVYEEEIPAGESRETSFRLPGGKGEAYLEVSSIPGLELGKRLNELIEYPHGCLEQITSAVFPQLVLGQFMALSESRKAAVERNVKAGIGRIRAYQLPGGGLAYWPGGREADEWGSSYAGHFMLEAQRRGYNLPPGFLDSWLRFQRGKAIAWAPAYYNFQGGDILQAYRLYLLALAGSAELGAMNRLREFEYLHPVAGHLLAAAYHLGGQPETAAGLVRSLPAEVRPYSAPGPTYGSALRDKALILQSLVAMGRSEAAGPMVQEVASQLSSASWFSTQTTAWSLIAIAAYCGSQTPASPIQAVYRFGGEEMTLNSASYVVQVPLKPAEGQQNGLVRNQGGNRLFVRWITRGQAAPGALGGLPEGNPRRLQLSVRYRNLQGEEIDPSRLAQGSDFVAEVSISHPGGFADYKEMSLSQIFPSGWEIINTRLTGNEKILGSSPFEYQDIRDDRVYTYFDLPAGATLRYHVLLNAAYLGRFFQPPVLCEAMYDASLSANAPGRWVEVFDPEGGN